MNIALFDFDGTITTEDSFSAFIFYATPKLRLWFGMLLLFPFILLYKLGLFPAAKIRPMITFVAFWRRNVAQVAMLARDYVDQHLLLIIRPQAQQRIDWHKLQGDKIIVVSASISPYLSIWCHQQGIECICSELTINRHRYTGRYKDGDCHGDNKVSAVHRVVNLSQFERIYAYGDTDEDIPMLALADVAYFQWQKQP
ncbi:HAD family hydrolase [Shewanella aestuarii]|uniref:HAD family hydrolase n=1 Tax=Shewanella aestuarii TaxID=1028752 RepID=A0A6G9QN50_9GAMM|nr:HAD family hydrolase [Shewanella aestuarii]QIR16014.1 HAD family hydrolase [Shewanella aestuarii]